MEKRASLYKSWLVSMPPEHYQTLKFLMEHLSRVKNYSKENLMGPTNLGVCLGPSLIRPPQSAQAEIQDANLKCQIIECMIQYYAICFE